LGHDFQSMALVIHEPYLFQEYESRYQGFFLVNQQINPEVLSHPFQNNF